MAKSIDDEIAFRSWLGQRLAGAGWFVLIAGFLLALPVLLGLDPMVLVVIAVVAGILAVLWVLLRRRVSVVARTGQPGPQWVRATLILTGTLGILAALPVYAMAVVSETRPVMMPQVVLSDGTRTVTFQGMVHVGTEAFYKSVVYDLERARADGYALYFEGVQPSTPEADRWFAETLARGADLNVAYDAVAQTCGLKFQSDYFAFLEAEAGADPGRLVIADVTTAEMQAEAERLAAADEGMATALKEATAAARANDGSAMLDQFVALQSEGTAGQKEIAGIVCRGVMSLVHGSDMEVDLGPLGPVVIDFRNHALAQRILGSEADRIFVTYGAGHLPGVTRILEAADPPWRVESVKWVRAIAPPEEFEADL